MLSSMALARSPALSCRKICEQSLFRLAGSATKAMNAIRSHEEMVAVASALSRNVGFTLASFALPDSSRRPSRAWSEFVSVTFFCCWLQPQRCLQRPASRRP